MSSTLAAAPMMIRITGLCGLLLLTGCARFQSSGQVGNDLKPRFGTSVSVPFGK